MSMQESVVAREEESLALASAPSWPTRYARFGQFQIDLQREELYRDGRRAKVQAKIYQALLVMIARPGDVITRDEVCRRLWPEALHASLDANVNTTINKLRLVLGDSTETPAYIETIPRRGYSFIASVEFSNDPLTVKPAATVDRTPPVDATSAGEENRWVWSLRRAPKPLRLASFVLIGMLMGALLVFAWKFASNKNQPTDSLGRQSVSLPSQPDHEI